MKSDYDKGYLTSMQKLRIALLASAIVLAAGMTGFIWLENMNPLDALYMTVITLSTVGFREVMPLHPAGKFFVIFLILFGVALAGFAASVIGQMALEGHFRDIIGRRKMDKRIRKMEGHSIIAGYGRVGRQVADEFSRKRAPFVVMEKSEDLIVEIQAEGRLFVQGDATDDDVLRKAGIDRAQTLISTLPDEAHNVYLTLTARYMNRNLKIIARADYDEGEKKLLRAGADHVVSPHVLGGTRMAMASLRPNVVDFMHMTAFDNGELSIEEVVIPSGSPLAGKTLVDSRLNSDYGVTIIGIKKPGKKLTITPGPDTLLDEKDILVLIGQADGLEKLESAMI
jgi:voltage-gated potassium channel